MQIYLAILECLPASLLTYVINSLGFFIILQQILHSRRENSLPQIHIVSCLRDLLCVLFYDLNNSVYWIEKQFNIDMFHYIHHLLLILWEEIKTLVFKYGARIVIFQV